MAFDDQYQLVINEQRDYLMKLQKDFNEACERIRKDANDQLAKLDPDDKENRETILQQQKTDLEAELTTLKNAVDASTRGTMKKLEELVKTKEAELLKELENELAKL